MMFEEDHDENEEDEEGTEDLALVEVDEECYNEEDNDVETSAYITELRDAIQEMKSAFICAQTQLQNYNNSSTDADGDGDGSVGNPSSINLLDNLSSELRTEMENTKTQCQSSSSEILRLILSLKTEVVGLRELLQHAQMSQLSLQSMIHTMLLERDCLIDELTKNGVLTQNFTRGHCRGQGVQMFGRSTSSNSQSTSDSGVALLLERTNAVFQQNNNLMMLNLSSLNHHHNHDGPSSDHHQENQHMNDFFLNGQFGHHRSGSAEHQTHQNGEVDGQIATNYSFTDGTTIHSYDSDSSLTQAASKSLSLSNSLSKQCGLELDATNNTGSSSTTSTTRDNLPVIESQTQNGNSEADGCKENNNLLLSTRAYICGREKETTEETTRGSSTCTTASTLVIDPNPNPITDNTNGPQQNEDVRLKVAKELLSTEQKYCQTLKIIQDTFAQPLKNSGILSYKDINTLFPEEIFDLYDKHCGFLAQLEIRIENWKSQPTIGNIIERFTNTEGSDVLRLYTNYVNDFPEVLKTFHKLCRNCGDFTRFLKLCLEKDECGGLDLGAFLLTPVQRMPRYILLLKQMIKYTESTHPDYKDINICLDRLRNYLKRLNDSMEHSFQLVTAQINVSPGQDSCHDKSEVGRGDSSCFEKNRFPRESISSSGSGSGGEEIVHKVRYKRSISVPRNQNEGPCSNVQSTPSSNTNCGGSIIGNIMNRDGKMKLKNKSKSDWTIMCNNTSNTTDGNTSSSGKERSSRSSEKSSNCNCSKSQSQGRATNKKSFNQLSRTLSDSDLNSAEEDSHDNTSSSSTKLNKKSSKIDKKFKASKSLHDFHNSDDDDLVENHDHTGIIDRKVQNGRRKSLDWATSEPNIHKNNHKGQNSKNKNKIEIESNDEGGFRNNVLIRPLGVSHHTHIKNQEKYVALIQPEPGKDKSTTHKKSIRTSLRNIFSIKKRNPSNDPAVKPNAIMKKENNSSTIDEELDGTIGIDIDEEWGRGSYKSFKIRSLDGRVYSNRTTRANSVDTHLTLSPLTLSPQLQLQPPQAPARSKTNSFDVRKLNCTRTLSNSSSPIPIIVPPVQFQTISTIASETRPLKFDGIVNIVVEQQTETKKLYGVNFIDEDGQECTNV